MRQDIGGESSQQSAIGAAEPERRIRRPARHLHEEQEQTGDEGERGRKNTTRHEPVGARRKNRPDLVVRRGQVYGNAGQMVASIEAGREEPSGRADDKQSEECQENPVESGRN